jgi:hypothetical protein
MSKIFLAAVLLIGSASASFAYSPSTVDVNSLSGKAMADHPGVNGPSAGTRFNANSEDSSLSGYVMRTHPGNRGGRTSEPLAKPQDDSLSGKAMHDHPGNG